MLMKIFFFECILKNIEKWTKKHNILFPIHPRTKKNLIKFNLLKKLERINNLYLVSPLSYSEFLLQLKESKFIITDSGGIQEEASFLGKPCFTLRKNTERPVTITMGSNKLVKLSDINTLINKDLKQKVKKIPKWDGQTAERIFKILKIYLSTLKL